MALLEVKNLHTHFQTKVGTIKSVNGVDLSLDEGFTLGIVGESGSGKSVTCMSVLQLLDTNGDIVEGEVLLDGVDISKYTENEMRDIRGNDISMIFQEPMTSLNPLHKVSKQISEVIILHQNKTKAEAHEMSVALLKEVGIPNPEQVAKQYPFQLSGGMRQRVMIAIALACKPRILIADEPTTALDVTIQAQILKLINDLKKQSNTSVIFITHDLAVISEMADEVMVMYCGRVVEKGSAEVIFTDMVNSHPYREGLLKSLPATDSDSDEEYLSVIEGSVPAPSEIPEGCAFEARCQYSTEKCRECMPDLVEVNPGHLVRCFYPSNRGGSHNE